MFSHLTRLYRLDLEGNPCIDIDFSQKSLEEIEGSLTASSCGAGYALYESQIERNQETCENKINGKSAILEKSFDQRLETIGKSIEANIGNLATRLDYLDKKFDELKEENLKENREIRKLLEKLIEMIGS
jgi:hypothetical protein